MSMNPNDPFEQPRQGQPALQSPPTSRSGKGCLIGCGVGSILVIFLCCGGGAMLLWFAGGQMGAVYESQLAGTPVIEEHIGDIESMNMSLSGTVEEAQRAENQGGQTALVFDVKGSKGSGQVVIVQASGGDGTGIESATLITSDGTRIPIDLGDDSPDPLEEDLDRELEGLFDEGDLDLGADAETTAP